MKMKLRVVLLCLVLVTLGAVSAYAQQKSDAAASASSTSPATPTSTSSSTNTSTVNSSTNTPSLGDLARKMKTEKPKESKPAKVFTNDNLPGAKWDDAVVSSTGGKDSADTATGTSGTSGAHDEKYYHTQMSKLQGQLDTDQRELDVLQQKLGQGNMQYYSNPQQELQQEYNRFQGSTGGNDLNKLNADIDAKKDQIAKDQQAIDDLRDQLRREGGDPGWLR